MTVRIDHCYTLKGVEAMTTLCEGCDECTQGMAMTPRAVTVTQGQRAAASRVGSQGGTGGQEPAARRVACDRRLVEAPRLREPMDTGDLVVSRGGHAFRLAIGITSNQAPAEGIVQDASSTVGRIDTLTAASGQLIPPSVGGRAVHRSSL